MISLTMEGADLRPDQLSAAGQGALDAEQVYFQYICQTVDGGHDPESEPDERVRDSHKALHGTIWRLDDPMAPVPPTSFGCRCGMRYCGAPGTVAAVVLGAEAETEPTSIALAFGAWLAKRLPGWNKYADTAKDQPAADRLGSVYVALKEDGVSGDARELSRMILSAGEAR